jgi:sugar lactone lactonase YvrE
MKRALPAILFCCALAGCGGATGPQSVPSAALPISANRVAPHARAANVYFSGNDADTTGVYGAAEIGSFSATANGNVAPLNTVKGDSTGFVALATLTLDPSGAIWACDFDANRAFKFKASDSGNVAPTTTLGSGATGLDDCDGVAVSSGGALYVASFGEDHGFKPSIFVWKAGAHDGDAPVRTIVGPKTQLHSTAGMAFDSGGKLFVGTAYHDSILVFNPSASGNAAPIRKIIGSQTQLSDVANVAIDPVTGNVWAANVSANSLTEYRNAANGNVSPLVTISGKKTKLNSPYGVAVDAAGYIYAGNCPQGVTKPPAVGAILVFAPGAHGNVAPVQQISGKAADISCVGGLAVK